jgi:hypothetical protein
MIIKSLIYLVNKNKIKDSSSIFTDSKFIIDDDLLTMFNKRYNYHTKGLYHNYKQNKQIFNMTYHKEYLILNNTYINDMGIIIKNSLLLMSSTIVKSEINS